MSLCGHKQRFPLPSIYARSTPDSRLKNLTGMAVAGAIEHYRAGLIKAGLPE
jgi:hypothetical protein